MVTQNPHQGGYPHHCAVIKLPSHDGSFFRGIPFITQIRVLQGYPVWVTITAAVVLSVTGRRVFLPHVKEVVTMIDIDTVTAIITLVVTAIGLGLQIASYINSSKNDRPTSQK